MSPNPEIISQSPESEIDKSIIKIIILGLLGIGLVLAAVYCFNQYLLTANAGYFWLTVLAGGFFFVITILDVFFIKSRLKIDLILFLEALAALPIYYSRLWPRPSVLLLAGAALFLVFLVNAVNRGLSHLANSLKINFWSTARAVLPTAVSGLLIFITVVLYLNYFEWGNFNNALGQSLVNGILSSANPILAIQFPKTSFNDTVHDFFAHIAEAQLKKINLNSLQNPSETLSGQSFSLLSPAAKEALIAQAAAQLKSLAEKSVGPLSDNLPVNSVIYQLLKNYVNHFSANALMALGIIAAVLIFFALKSLMSLLYWLVIFIAFVVFKFLIVVDFAYINLETRSREYIMLS